MISEILNELNRLRKIRKIKLDDIARPHEFREKNKDEYGRRLSYFPECYIDEETELYILPDGRYLPTGVYFDRETMAKIIYEPRELEDLEFDFGIVREDIEYLEKLDQEEQDK